MVGEGEKLLIICAATLAPNTGTAIWRRHLMISQPSTLRGLEVSTSNYGGLRPEERKRGRPGDYKTF